MAVDIKPTLLRSLFDRELADEVARIAEADVNDLFMAEPSYADYQIIMSALDMADAKAVAERDQFILRSVVKNGEGGKVLSTEMGLALSASVASQLVALASAMCLAIHRSAEEDIKERLGKLGISKQRQAKTTEPPKPSSS